MITMKNLGKNGRIGNQMFQYCFLAALAKNKKLEYCIPANTDISKCFQLTAKVCKITKPKRVIQEKIYNYDENIVRDVRDGDDFWGYFQTERYFKKQDAFIRKELTFKSNIINSKKVKDYLKMFGPESTSIHVRRGDYLKNEGCHPAITTEYINRAKSLIGGNKHIVFSDDLKWCKENNIGDIYVEGTNHYEDLYLMSKCKNNIISNSSFSWWAAWLNINLNKKVVAPATWFGDKCDKYNDTKDLYCEGWIKI